MISDEAYRSSTQYRHFSFPSKEELNAQRARANASAQSQLPPEISYLTVDEDIELVDHYVTKLWELCRHFRAKSSVRVPSPLLLPFVDRSQSGRSNEFSSPLLPSQHTINNTSPQPLPNSPLPRFQNRKPVPSTGPL